MAYKSLESTMRYLVPSQEVNARLDQVTVLGLGDEVSLPRNRAAKRTGPGRTTVAPGRKTSCEEIPGRPPTVSLVSEVVRSSSLEMRLLLPGRVML